MINQLFSFAVLSFLKAVVAVRAYNKAYEFVKHVWKKKKEIMEYDNLEKEVSNYCSSFLFYFLTYNLSYTFFKCIRLISTYFF